MIFVESIDSARRRRIEREVHPPDGLEGGVELLQNLPGTEGGADHVGLGEVRQAVVAEREHLRFDAGGLEHLLHDRDAEVAVCGGPDVEFRVAFAFRDLHGLRRRMDAEKKGGHDHGRH